MKLLKTSLENIFFKDFGYPQCLTALEAYRFREVVQREQCLAGRMELFCKTVQCVLRLDYISNIGLCMGQWAGVVSRRLLFVR